MTLAIYSWIHLSKTFEPDLGTFYSNSMTTLGKPIYKLFPHKFVYQAKRTSLRCDLSLINMAPSVHPQILDNVLSFPQLLVKSSQAFGISKISSCSPVTPPQCPTLLFLSFNPSGFFVIPAWCIAHGNFIRQWFFSSLLSVHQPIDDTFYGLPSTTHLLLCVPFVLYFKAEWWCIS